MVDRLAWSDHPEWLWSHHPDVEYRDEHVSLSVCLSVQMHISRTTHSVHVALLVAMAHSSGSIAV